MHTQQPLVAEILYQSKRFRSKHTFSEGHTTRIYAKRQIETGEIKH